MKIAIMGRTLDDGGGVGVANRNLIDKIIELDEETEYVVFYRSRNTFGRYKHRPNVREVLFRSPNKFVWDQVLVPYFARKERVDLILNPKFTVPILTGRMTVPVCQGTEYFTFRHYYGWMDRLHTRVLFPMYYKKATKVITVSDDVGHDLHRFLNVPYDRMETVYLAAGEHYYQRTDVDELERFGKRHRLPDQFILAVTEPYQNNRRYPRKNIDGILKSFLALGDEHPRLKLVLAGKRCHEYIAEGFGQEVADDPRLVYPGWIPQEEMPLLYSLAKCLVFPSFSESFGLPIVEAMACGCPVVTSTGGACPEVAGDAALVVEPTDVEGLTSAITRILKDPELSRSLTAKGLKRASDFSWARSAEKVNRICRGLVNAQGAPSQELGANL